MFAPTSVRSRKIDSGIAASRDRASQTTKPASRTSDAAKKANVSAEPQPYLFACVIAYTSVTRPPVTSAAPGRSKLRAFASRLSSSSIGARRKRDHADRGVDVEDPLPAQQVREDPAEQDAGDGAERADRAPGAEGRVALGALRERRREDRQGGGGDDRRAEALDRAGADERALAPREAGQQRGDAEDDDADHEHAPASEEVGGAAAQEQEPAEQQRVGADDPLQVLLGEAEVGLDRRQCDVHHRDVEHDHELDRAEEGQGVPLVAGGSFHDGSLSYRQHELAERTRSLSFCKYGLPHLKFRR